MFCDEAFEITDDCKESGDILNSVLGERPVFNTHFEMGEVSSHYIFYLDIIIKRFIKRSFGRAE